jgi:sugar phosphate permease
MSRQDKVAPASQTEAKGKFFYGWWIVAACFIVYMWGAGTFFYGFTAFFDHIRNDFQWGATVTSVAFALRSAESGLADILIGFLVDRFGPRLLMTVGIISMGAGFVCLGFIDSLWSFYASVALIAIGLSSTLGPVGVTAVVNWFVRKRGRAVGILMAGAGAGGIMVPLISWSINTVDWRTTAIIMGVATWVLLIPLTRVVRHKPEQYGYLPDGDQPGEEAPEIAAQQSEGTGHEFSVKEALRTRAFWFLSVAYATALAALMAVTLHIIPYLTSDDIGLSEGTAALMVTLMTVSSIAGRLGFGWLGDYFPKRYVIAVCFSIQAAAVLFFAYCGSLWMAILFVCIFGPAYGGSIPLRAVIQADYFGRKAFGAIFGIVMAIGTLLGMASPVFAGAMVDATGSYRIAWMVLALVVAVSVPLILLARPPALPRKKEVGELTIESR